LKRILIEIGHPAHVHQFKNMYWELKKQGWEGLFVTKDKECAIDLLTAYQLPFKVLGATKQGIATKILSLPYFAVKMLKIALGFKPNMFVSRVSPLSGWSSFLMGKPHITFTDTENVKLMDAISEPFADVVLTSSAYLRDHGKRQIRYPGYHELAYLHPNRFVPNPYVLKKLGLREGDNYAIVRFVSWTAHHDIGQSGFAYAQKLSLIRMLESKMKVLISSEAPLNGDLDRLAVRIPPEEMHDLLYYASLFIGEGATMAEESAVLGTPAIYINSITGGVIQDLEGYGLLFRFSNSAMDQEAAIQKALKIASDPTIKQECGKQKDRMLSDRIDVTSFIVWFISEYPQSYKRVNEKSFSFNRFFGIDKARQAKAERHQ